MKLKSPLPDYIAFSTPELAFTAIHLLARNGYKFGDDAYPLLDSGWSLEVKLNPPYGLEIDRQTVETYAGPKLKGLPVITSLSEFRDFILEKPLMAGTYDVTDITEKGFKVGCQEVTWEQFDAIAEKRPVWTAKCDPNHLINGLPASDIAPGINPHKLTNAQVGEGWRLCEVEGRAFGEYWYPKADKWEGPEAIYFCRSNSGDGTVRVRIPAPLFDAHGWRELGPEEKGEKFLSSVSTRYIQQFVNGGEWDATPCKGCYSDYTYRTRLTPRVLAALRANGGVWHNPEGVKDPGEGFRFLLPEEVKDRNYIDAIELHREGGIWDKTSWQGSTLKYTYRLPINHDLLD